MIVAILLGSAVASRAADAPKRVLILHAYNYTFPATTIASETARKRLLAGSRQAIEIEADFLDLARMPGDVHAMRTANFLREKYAKMHFDLVLVIGTEGVPFIIKYRDVISPGVPVVFAGGSAENYAAIQLPPDVTGVMSGFDLDKMLELAERLQPNVTRFVVIGGSGRADRGWQAATRKAIEARKRKFETAFRVDLTYDAMLAEVSRLPSDTIVLLLSVYADSAGRPLIPRDVAGAVAKASAAPVYGPFGTFLGSGVVGGYVETYESMGIATADLALEILSGKDPATLPPRINPGQDFRVDARAMQRWGLKQSNLPPDSIVMFQEPGLWDEHRNLVLGTISIIVLQALFLAGLLFQRRRRRQAETSLRESEERMTFTAASVNVGLWQFDRTTDELWATEHCRSMFGLAKDVPLTRETFIAAVHPEDRRAAVGTLRGALRGQAAMTDVRVVCPDGGVRWIRVRARSHLDDKGTPDQLNGLFVDITDQKTAETEAEQQRQEVTHLMRVSVMGELSGAIAHEVNQPLTAILTNAETALYLLDQDSLNHAEMRNTLLDIVSEDKRAGEVVQRLRGLLKKGESRSEEVNINELVDSTTALLRSELIRRQVLVESDLGANLAVVLGDSVQLQQVLLNLVVNAMDAMSTTPAPQRRVMIRTLQTPTGDIQVLIKDHGHGIKMANGKQAFEPFYTTKDHGLGLGLSICSTIVRKHGGTINLRNDDAGGAVAEFSLPARVMMMAAQ
ncbi:ABC transporter substrate binding protein [Bradyrhizobium sp. OAE829]|uniref:sensor histidine kinase n=1 Tax=Bradyrhizobium sp. OAE829 TaxID=2663807 RepID=UPI0017899434